MVRERRETTRLDKTKARWRKHSWSFGRAALALSRVSYVVIVVVVVATSFPSLPHVLASSL